jgi:hypothetical protein
MDAVMELINFYLVVLRAFLYPLISFMICVVAYSTNNRHHARLFRIHLMTAVIFAILGAMAMIRAILNDDQMISALGNYLITPILILYVINLAKIAIGEERNYVREMKGKFIYGNPARSE